MNQSPAGKGSRNKTQVSIARKTIRAITYPVYLILAITLLLELALHLYNPLHFRQKGNSVILPRNRKMIFTNNTNPSLKNRPLIPKTLSDSAGPNSRPILTAIIPLFVVVALRNAFT